ncbi:chordin-like [Plakobranchus ocellatus]|uniref:Chordin-like n=1 Tax=Plakobranchus ocellatus TaxID=259542 RepID=A0AAV3ZC83_9GAST|nr:chordin-like [Plakobranchus ocellatus]
MPAASLLSCDSLRILVALSNSPSSLKILEVREQRSRLNYGKLGYKVEGEISNLPDLFLLALDRGYAFLQMFVDFDRVSTRTGIGQIRVTNSCWRSQTLAVSQNNITAIQLGDQGSLEEQKDPTATVDERAELGEPSPTPNCTFEGHVYQEGVAWLPDVDARCTTCSCVAGGRAECKKMSCPVLLCDQSQWVKSDTDPCCYTCGPPRSTAPPTELPQQDVNMTGACVVQNQLRRDGETWHPYMQPFGYMKCFQCHCKDSHYRCERLSCPQLKCSKRKKLPNVCCEICEGDETSHTSNARKLPKKKVKQKKTGPKAEKKRSYIARKVCKVNEKVYAHGDKWKPTLSPSDNCAVCRCKNGRAKCRMRCPKSCQMDKTSHRCCKYCTEAVKMQGENSGKTHRKQNSDRKFQAVATVSKKTNLIHFLRSDR